MSTKLLGALPAIVVLATGTLAAQPERVSVQLIASTTSMPDDVMGMLRVDSLIAEMSRAGELVLTVSEPDRQVPGRRLEHFRQFHRGVPVLGAGITRQRVGEATVGAFGTLFSGVDLPTRPSLEAEGALDRIEEAAGTGPATLEAPTLVVLRTLLGRMALAWRAPMRDFQTWFIDAHSGEILHRQKFMRQGEPAIGFGLGITGAPQKLSVERAADGYLAKDLLRPAEIVTLDLKHNVLGLYSLMYSWLEGVFGPPWQEMIATDNDNEWSDSGIVDAHAHVGFVYDYLLESHGWRGVDGEDGRIFNAVNIGIANAVYVHPPAGPDRTGIVGFGVIEGVSLAVLDIVGHEMGHGVVDAALRRRTGSDLIGGYDFILGSSTFRLSNEEFRCGDSFLLGHDNDGNEVYGRLLCATEDGVLTSSGEGRFALYLDSSGAIHEAFGDIIAASAEFSVHLPGQGPLRADYVLGEDAGFELRRMDDPRADRISASAPFFYPDAYGQAYRFVLAEVAGLGIFTTGLGQTEGRPFRLRTSGYNGEHWNSTILSHAFYLAIEGGTHRSSGRAVTGVGAADRTAVEQAFVRALHLVPADATVRTMGVAIRQSAVDLHGAGSAAHTAIDQALTAVGL